MITLKDEDKPYPKYKIKEMINLTDKEQVEHKKAVKRMCERYPNIPPEVFDIEASDEIALMYQGEFGMYQ